MNSPKCSRCGSDNTQASGAAPPSAEEQADGAGRCELHQCHSCGYTSRSVLSDLHCNTREAACLQSRLEASLSQLWRLMAGLPLQASPAGATGRCRALMLCITAIDTLIGAMCCADSLTAAGSRDTTTQSSCWRHALGAAGSGPTASRCAAAARGWMCGTVLTGQITSGLVGLEHTRTEPVKLLACGVVWCLSMSGAG